MKPPAAPRHEARPERRDAPTHDDRAPIRPDPGVRGERGRTPDTEKRSRSDRTGQHLGDRGHEPTGSRRRDDGAPTHRTGERGSGAARDRDRLMPPVDARHPIGRAQRADATQGDRGGKPAREGVRPDPGIAAERELQRTSRRPSQDDLGESDVKGVYAHAKGHAAQELANAPHIPNPVPEEKPEGLSHPVQTA